MVNTFSLAAKHTPKNTTPMLMKVMPGPGNDFREAAVLSMLNGLASFVQ